MWIKRVLRWLRRRERGQSYVEFVIALPLFMIMIAGVTWYGQALYTRLAVDAAAWSGCRHAIASLNPQRGQMQGSLGARHTLSGFGLNPDSAQVHIMNWGQWNRGTQVQVQVCYNVPAPPVPWGDVFSPAQVCAQQKMPVYQYKSRW